MIYRRFGKRAFDLVLTVPAAILLAPLCAVIALGLLWTDGRPVLFRQRRPGLHGRPFTLLKFRSMRSQFGRDGEPLRDAQRITRFGAFLRQTSLDELPELWNVLAGDMSLVGPRPLLMEYLGRYSDEHMRRHEVRPGLTGWAQVRGRQELPFSARFALDVWYVDHCKLSLDLKIIAMTVAQVFRRRGVILGQDVGDVDDLGLSVGLRAERESGPS